MRVRSNNKSYIGKNKKNVTDVLVFCGMRDSNNYIGKVLTTLCKANYKENVTIAIGSSSPNLEKILSSIKDYNFSVNVEIDSKSLYDLLIDFDNENFYLDLVSFLSQPICKIEELWKEKIDGRMRMIEEYFSSCDGGAGKKAAEITMKNYL